GNIGEGRGGAAAKPESGQGRRSHHCSAGHSGVCFSRLGRRRVGREGPRVGSVGEGVEVEEAMSLHNRLDKLLLLARAAAEVQRQRDALKRPTMEIAEVCARVRAALADEDADLVEEIKHKTKNPQSPYMEPVFVQWLKWLARGYGSIPARIPRALLEGF